MTREKKFTGEGLAKALLLDLTTRELMDYFKKNPKRHRAHSDGFLATLWRRIKRRKIFYIKFADGYGVIIMGDNEEDACIEAVPFLHEHGHSCKNPNFNKACDECRAAFDGLAEILTTAVLHGSGGLALTIIG